MFPVEVHLVVRALEVVDPPLALPQIVRLLLPVVVLLVVKIHLM
jgi:hypothetical protein